MDALRRLASTLAIAALVVPAGAGATHTGIPQTKPPAPANVQAFVKAALADRFQAKDIPDLKLLDSSVPVGIRSEMPEAGKRLEEAALPVVGLYRFFLLSPADAQTAADRDAKPLAFVTVDQPIINGDSATILIGVDIALPRTSHDVKMCCCTGNAEFRRTPDGWSFVKWSTMICS